MEFNFQLHPAQLEIINDPARFKVVAAGRRFGKSYLAKVMLAIEALKTEKNGRDLSNINVAYIAPTFKQARQIMWGQLKEMFAPLGPRANEMEGVLGLPNGRNIFIFGADRPDTMRGNAFSFVVLDEFANMRPETWTHILRPALADCQGGALFIGTPAGKNHFYELHQKAEKAPRWSSFSYASADNPYIDYKELRQASADMSSDIASQEFEANFSAFGGTIFKSEWWRESDKPLEPRGEVYMAVDLAGFDTVAKKYGKTQDQHAIAVVEVGPSGWYVLNVEMGHWDVRECAVRILREAQIHRPVLIGIEKGSLKNAVMPYLQDQMKRLGTFPAITQVSHGNQNKQGRIQWALQGRAEAGRLVFKPGAYTRKIKEEMADFPNPTAHDDGIDALSYIAQISNVSYEQFPVIDDWDPLDEAAGY